MSVGTRLAVSMIALATIVAGTALRAQDSFPDKLPAPRSQSASERPAPKASPATQPSAAEASTPTRSAAPAGSSGETQDFGVAPVSRLRPTDQLHGPTPTSIPGGRVVGTQQLAQWMQRQPGQGQVMLLHAIASNRHLPNAIPAVPASQGGSFDDQVQRDFGAYLQRATGGDRSRLIVTYCAGVQCWGSYNAALRAIRLGYTNVHWYRGGIEAWQQAGLPVLTAPDQGAATARNSQQGPR